jgi:hypothetical protein
MLTNIVMKLERAFTLWAKGNITIDIAEDSKKFGKPLTLQPGHDWDGVGGGGGHIAFNEYNWGDASRDYTASAAAISAEHFEAICQLAKAQAKLTRRAERAASGSSSARARPHAQLVYVDEDCKFFMYVFHVTSHDLYFYHRM